MGEVAQINPIVEARHQIANLEPQFKAALPAHIPAERFSRVVMTALQNNSDLLHKVDRKSLWNAAMRAAQDGLLPDGRDGAIVPYKGKAQWMPMIGGIRKKARNSGEISTWEAHCVYENDEFDFQLGDEPYIKHRPMLGERGKLIGAYSVATLKDGSKSREVMSVQEIEGVRSKSKGENTPWNDPIFYPEMVRKTVARRHSKVLPMSSDLDDLIRRDDELYELGNERPHADAPPPKPALHTKLDNLAALPTPEEKADATPVVPVDEPEPEPQHVGDPIYDDLEIPPELRRTADNKLPPPQSAKDKMLSQIAKLATLKECQHWLDQNRENTQALSELDFREVSRVFVSKQGALKRAAKETA